MMSKGAFHGGTRLSFFAMREFAETA